MAESSLIPLYGRILKRCFDIIASLAGLLLLWWVIVAAWVVATLDTGMNGLFMQKRVGLRGKLFTVYKIRTMLPSNEVTTCVTAEGDPRITGIGRIFRKLKIDELPQLVNVLLGDMSFVGPRPDIPEYAQTLAGDDRLVLSVRPGITGPATLKYRNEEAFLASQDDPEAYNREVIWPDKVKINKEYIRNWSIQSDISCIFHTIFLR